MTRDECETQFQLIRASKNPREIETHLRTLLDVFPILSFVIGRGSIFWRGRPASSQPFNYVREMSCPPPALAGVGRLNDPGCPCLYSASRRSTVLAELHAKVGDYVQLIGFKIKPKGELRLGTIGEIFHVSETGYLRNLGKDPESGISALLNSMDQEKAKTWIFVDAFLASLLSDPNAKDKQYLHTRILANLVCEKQGWQDYFTQVYNATLERISLSSLLFMRQKHLSYAANTFAWMRFVSSEFSI
jgi:hypothetical protein